MIPSDATLVDSALRRAQEQTAQTAYIFLENGEAATERITYGELDRKARATAVALAARGNPGDLALLLYPPGISYICAYFGCLYAGWIPVPAHPPDPARLTRTLPRIQGILSDAKPRLVLMSSSIEQQARPMLSRMDEASQMPDLLVPETNPAPPEDWRRPTIGPDSLALVQYTSGSVAAPKGVLVTHANLIDNMRQIHLCGHGGRIPVAGVSWLPPYHDMGLIGGILQSLYFGFPTTLMPPMAFLARPVRWLRAISDSRATLTVSPNFGFAIASRRVKRQDIETLDLSSLDVVGNGSEPLRRSVMEEFARTFGPCGFRRDAFAPCYGLAEATLLVTGTRGVRWKRFDRDKLASGVAQECTETDTRHHVDLVSSGHAAAGTVLRIVDPEARTELEDGQVGEIWTRSESMAKGYFERPQETLETFGASLVGQSQPFLRTGDLGFMLDDHLYVVGRIKDLIIQHGRNIYPPELERSAESSHGSVRMGCCAVFSIEEDGQEQVVVVAEVERRWHRRRRTPDSEPPGQERRHSDDRRKREADPTGSAFDAGAFDTHKVRDAIRQRIFRDHDVRVAHIALIRPGSIHKTPSGKVQRRKVRSLFLAGQLELIEPEGE